MAALTNAPFDSYSGTEPFLFVSYSHKDGELVFKEIERLHKLGFRIWYDEGIDPGSEWTEEIAEALTKCGQFLVFISANSVASQNVRNEINFAINKRRPFLAVHFEQVELPMGLELQMASIQAILKWSMTEERYWRKLDSAILDEIGNRPPLVIPTALPLPPVPVSTPSLPAVPSTALPPIPTTTTPVQPPIPVSSPGLRTLQTNTVPAKKSGRGVLYIVAGGLVGFLALIVVGIVLLIVNLHHSGLGETGSPVVADDTKPTAEPQPTDAPTAQPTNAQNAASTSNTPSTLDTASTGTLAAGVGALTGQSGNSTPATHGEVIDFITNYLKQSGSEADGDEGSFFAPSIQYYGEAKTLDAVRSDIDSYDQKWTKRSFAFSEVPNVEDAGTDLFKVTFTMNFDVSNDSDHRTGSLNMTIKVQQIDKDLKITEIASAPVN